jgi:hypothetical protein
MLKNIIPYKLMVSEECVYEILSFCLYNLFSVLIKASLYAANL